MAQNSITLKDIAVSLGLSINTVSRSLRNCSDISLETKNKVNEKAKQLGYLSQKLVGYYLVAKEKTIVFIYDTLDNPYFIKMSEKLIKAYEKYGYQVIITPIPNKTVTIKDIKRCILKNANLCVSFIELDKKAIDYAAKMNYSVILVGRHEQTNKLDMIYTNDFAGGCLAAKHLLKSGAHKFLYISYDLAECSTRRFDGFNETIRKNGKNYLIEKIDAHDCKGIVEKIKSDGFDGIFIFNDAFALKILECLLSQNVDLNNINFVGYDNTVQQFDVRTCNYSSISANYNEIVKRIVDVTNTRLDINTQGSKKKKLELKVGLSIIH